MDILLGDHNAARHHTQLQPLPGYVDGRRIMIAFNGMMPDMGKVLMLRDFKTAVSGVECASAIVNA